MHPTSFVTCAPSNFCLLSLVYYVIYDAYAHACYVRHSIIGLSDGLTVPFALTAGLSSLGSSKLVYTGGMAELISGAISMGVGGYLASEAERDHFRYCKRVTRVRPSVFVVANAYGREINARRVCSSLGTRRALVRRRDGARSPRPARSLGYRPISLPARRGLPPLVRASAALNIRRRAPGRKGAVMVALGAHVLRADAKGDAG